jgi:hypothetical protein
MPAPQTLLPHAHRTDDEQPLAADDLAAIQLLAVPEIGPPFDDDPAAKAMAGRAALSQDAARTRGPAPAPDPRTGNGGADGDWARQFARLLTEALSGARPVRQILPWTSERARVQLRGLVPLFAGGQRPRVLRVIASRPTRDVIEMTAVVGVGGRTRALAVRLERTARPEPAERTGRLSGPPATAPRWLCTDIEAA